MDILNTRDTYRLALKGSLTLSPLVLTDYRFSLTVLLLLRLRISAEGDNAAGYLVSESHRQDYSKYFTKCYPYRSFKSIFRPAHFVQVLSFSVTPCFTFVCSYEVFLMEILAALQSSTVCTVQCALWRGGERVSHSLSSLRIEQAALSQLL